jgi:Zn-dependent protease
LDLSDLFPRPWLLRFLPLEWAIQLPPSLSAFCATLLDVSFSIGVLNLVPAFALDGAYASRQLLKVLGWGNSAELYRYLRVGGTFLLLSNAVLALGSVVEMITG